MSRLFCTPTTFIVTSITVVDRISAVSVTLLPAANVAGDGTGVKLLSENTANPPVDDEKLAVVIPPVLCAVSTEEPFVGEPKQIADGIASNVTIGAFLNDTTILSVAI